MRLEKLIRKFEALAPSALALSWDNPGLLCGRREKEIKKVMIALDASMRVVERAVSENCDLLLTHHPMLFKPVSKINDETALGEKLLALIGHDIACFAMHTNFDAAPGCMADLVCERIGAEKESPLEPSVEDAEGISSYGIGFVGILSEATDAALLTELLTERFALSGASYYDAGRSIRRIAVCPGSGRGMLSAAKRFHADVLIAGDMGHHDGIDAIDDGISLIDAGHFGLEHLFVEFMERFLSDCAPELCLVTDLEDYRVTLANTRR